MHLHARRAPPPLAHRPASLGHSGRCCPRLHHGGGAGRALALPAPEPRAQDLPCGQEQGQGVWAFSPGCCLYAVHSRPQPLWRSLAVSPLHYCGPSPRRRICRTLSPPHSPRCLCSLLTVLAARAAPCRRQWPAPLCAVRAALGAPQAPRRCPAAPLYPRLTLLPSGGVSVACFIGGLQCVPAARAGAHAACLGRTWACPSPAA